MMMRSEDVCKATSSLGHIGILSNQQLSESLVHERLRSEQHRLNYERLRTLYEKLQNDMNTLTTTDGTDVKNKQKKNTTTTQEEDDDDTPVSATAAAVPTDLVKSLKQCSLQIQPPPPPPPPPPKPNAATSKNLVHLPQLLSSVLLSPNSTTGLTDDNNEAAGAITQEDLNLIGGPHHNTNEILRQCTRWKELYLNLLDEFEQYKYLNDVMLMNNDQVLTEKVREANHELDEIRTEQDGKLEKLRSRLDNLIRDRIVLQTEIKAIREQLAETNEKLREKTILCEALQRQIDENSMNSLKSHEKRCEIPTHAELGNKLSAAEGRVMFLQEEINEISNNNIRLQDKIFSLIRESTNEITTLRKALCGNEEQVVKAQVELQHQQDEALEHLHVQQAYIEDLDKFVTERVEQNNEVSQKVQDFASQVAQETEHTLQLLEDRLKKTTEEKEILEESLLKASKVIHELTAEARRQRVTASRFITHIYQILSIPPGEDQSKSEVSELRTLPYVVLCDNIVNSINDDSQLAPHTYTLDTSIHMKELLKRVIFWTRQFELQKRRLRDRVSQLEKFQTDQKKLAIDEIERYRKKCSFYREILRQLRNKLGIEAMDETLKNVLPPHIYVQARNWLNKHKKGLGEKDHNNVVPTTTSSIDKFGEDGEREGGKRFDPPEEFVSGVSQAQHKFGPRSTQVTTSTATAVRPFTGSNLHSYLKQHERFARILDNVEKYLSQPENFLDDDDLARIDS